MPEKRTRKKAASLKRKGTAASTQASPYVEEEIRHVRQGKHGARSTKQAIAIGLSKARQDGVKLPAKGGAKRRSTKRRSSGKKSAKRSRATLKALKREPRRTASKKALSRQARTASRKRSSKKR